MSTDNTCLKEQRVVRADEITLARWKRIHTASAAAVSRTREVSCGEVGAANGSLVSTRQSIP
jgi:hypothetical protein